MIKFVEFSRAYADFMGYTYKDSRDICSGFITMLIELLAKGESIQFNGFGRFDVYNREARPGMSFGEKVMLPEKKFVKFKAALPLIERVNEAPAEEDVNDGDNE